MSLSITGTPSASASFNTAFSETFTASGGTPAYVYSISAGSLPTGLSIGSSTGIISGTSTVAGYYAFTVKVTDSLSATATIAASITTGEGWLIIDDPTLGLVDRSTYLHIGEGVKHDWNLALRKRGQAQVELDIFAGDTYAPTRGTPLYLCDITSNGPVYAVEPDFHVYSTAGTGKTLLCANTGAIPAGWTAPSFNDSSWIAPVLQTGTTFGTALAGSQWITPDTSGPTGIDNETALYRIPFTTSSVPPSGSLTLWSDNFNIGVWLNGTQVFAGSGTNFDSITLPGSAFVSGTNVLAIEVLNGLAWLDCDFVLTVNKAITTSPVAGAIWSGLIQNLDYKWLDDAGNQAVTITAVSFESIFDTVLCEPYLYINQDCGFIVSDLLSRVETGCQISAGTISAGATIPQLALNYEKVSDIFDELAKTSQFVWGVNPQTLQLFFQTSASITAPFTLQNDDVLKGSLSYTLDGSDYRNKQVNKLSYDAFAHSMEYFTGSGQTQFTLMRPVQQVVAAYATLNTCNTATGTFSGQPSPGDTITIGPAAGAWQASHIYGPNGIIIVGGYVFQITFPSSGTATSGSAEPTFSSFEVTGDTVTDGSVIWTCRGPAGLGTGVGTWTFVSSLDNTQYGQILIGANDTATCLNTVDCLNANAAVRGITFSTPTWENSQINAINNTGTSFTAQQKASGSGWVAALSATGSHFSWSSAETMGGTAPQGSLGPGEGATISLGVYASGTSTEAPAVVYTAGSAVINLATPLNTGSNLNVEYTRADGNVIECERTDLVLALAAITGGTGKYQQITDDSSQGLISTNAASGLLDCQTTLESYCVAPTRIEFKTYVPGLFPGMTLPVDLSAPTGATALLNGEWIIEEVKAEIVSTTQPYLGIFGHYQYTVSMVDIQQTVGYLDFWQGMAGASQGGSGGGGAVVSTGGGAESMVGQGTLELQTNTVDNATQTKLNLIPGSHITITDDGLGDITFAWTSPLTTKGDIVTYGTSTTRLGVGSNGQVLTADSTQTNGLAWEALPTATSSVSGVVKVDNTSITASSGVISATAPATATTSTLGLVKPDGTTIDVSAGVISVPTATTSLLGLVKPDGTTVTISSGVITSVGSNNGGINYQTGNYTPTNADSGKLILFNSSSPITCSLNPFTISANTVWDIQNDGTGTLTVDPFDGSLDLPGGGLGGGITLSQHQGCRIFCGTGDYYASMRGMGSSSGGTVTSVAMTVPSDLSISGSPITSSGTFAITRSTQSANTFLAGPSSGSAATPAYRAIASADLPVATSSVLGGVKVDGTSIVASGGVISATSALSNPMTSQGDLIAGGTSGTPTRLAPGTSGYILQTNGSGSAPTWVTPPSGAVSSLTTTGSSGAATLSSGVLNIPVYTGGGGGSTVSVGTRASLPGTIPASGSVYRCTDSPYEYISNGSAWLPFLGGYPVVEPTTSGLTAIHSGTVSLSSSITTYGGIQVIATQSGGSGDQFAGYGLPVTPSSTLAVVCGGPMTGQAGPFLYNANNGNVVFLRMISASPFQLYYSRYTSSGASLSSNVTNQAMPPFNPPTVNYGFAFDGTKWYLALYAASWNGTASDWTGYNENLSSFIGTNYTHIGMGSNLGGPHVWFQHIKVVHT